MVKSNGLAPPTITTFNVVLWPTQIGLDPAKLSVALVGGEVTVTVVLLVAAPKHPVASWILVIAYVLVDAGLTTTV